MTGLQKAMDKQDLSDPFYQWGLQP